MKAIVTKVSEKNKNVVRISVFYGAFQIAQGWAIADKDYAEGEEIPILPGYSPVEEEGVNKAGTKFRRIKWVK